MLFSLRSKPGAAYWLAAFGLLLCVGAGLKAVPLLAWARSAVLADAQRVIVAATAPLVEQQHIPPGLVHVVEQLIDQPKPALNYVTVRNANNTTLVSRGRLTNALDWLPMGQARQWRAWLYRLRSAEDTRPIRRDGQRLGTIHYGVPWSAVWMRAGAALVFWLAVFAFGLLALGWGLMRARVAAPAPAPTPASRLSWAVVGGVFLSRIRGVGHRRPLRQLTWRMTRDNEFAPIAAYSLTEQAPDDEVADPGPPVAKDTPGVEPVEPIPPSSPSLIGPAISAPQAAGQRPLAEVKQFREHTESSPGAIVSNNQPNRPVTKPKLGDTTLDLRLFPIWRGVERQVLAGAWAALAWRSGTGEVVDAMRLTQLAEKDGALRAFTQWIAQRFSMLYSNWRTLELATVPILLPVPSILFGFADAEAVWRVALRRIDRDPDDLILRVKHPDPIKQAVLSLPIRRAFALDTVTDLPVSPVGADIVCVTPETLNDNAAEAVDRIDAMQRPVLFGPIAEPEPWAETINKPDVCWFCDTPRPDNLHTPRSFARLLARYRTRPI